MMSVIRVRVLSLCAISLLGANGIGAGEEAIRAQCNTGSLTFAAPTNMLGIEVAGKSTLLTAAADISANGDQLSLRNLQAAVPVTTLTTGMKLRDEHMRKYIFRTTDGKEPDLRFSSEGAACASTSAHDYQCPLKGLLMVRGIEKQFEAGLKVKEEGGAFHASLDAIIKLSTYGIERPTQFGVKPDDVVKVHVDFTARAKTAVANNGSPR
jgi:polyisoprenoid-binding protein YceI